VEDAELQAGPRETKAGRRARRERELTKSVHLAGGLLLALLELALLALLLLGVGVDSALLLLLLGLLAALLGHEALRLLEEVHVES
jgi:hypothetical protein